jgi:hypothetical protein
MLALPGPPAVQGFSVESSTLIRRAEQVILETREVLDDTRDVLKQWHKTKASTVATRGWPLSRAGEWQADSGQRNRNAAPGGSHAVLDTAIRRPSSVSAPLQAVADAPLTGVAFVPIVAAAKRTSTGRSLQRPPRFRQAGRWRLAPGSTPDLW